MKIGILTFHRATNFGAVLQAYALQNKIQKILYSKGNNDVCKIIDYRCKSIENMRKHVHLDKRLPKDIIRLLFVYNNDSQTIKKFDEFLGNCFSIQELKNNNLDELNTDYDLFITGSDQVWNYDVCLEDDAYFLTFVKDNNKKKSYAASVGARRLFLRDRVRILKNLSGFKELSIREGNCINELSSITTEIHIDIDPTLLLDFAEWEKVFKTENRYGDYILIYCVAPPQDLLEIARKLSKKTGYKVIYLSNLLSQKVKYSDFEFASGEGPREFLNLILNAKFVLTTSYHGTVFSLLFHTVFYAELDSKNGHNDRIDNLLTALDAKFFANSNTLFKEPEELNIEWSLIDKKILSMRKSSEEYLNKIVLCEEQYDGTHNRKV